MLVSCSLILLCGLLFGEIFKKLKLPSLIGMLLVGILLGPCVLGLLDDSILNISADIRKMALIIILTRAGLNLNLNDLKKVGRSALLMSFLPACFEIMGMVLLAPKILGLNLVDSLVLGSVIAAVSPAVVVPKMVKLIDENKGCKKSIPQLILAGASIDDVFVIALFTSFTSFSSGGSFSFSTLLEVPISIIVGIVVGIIIGYLLAKMISSLKLNRMMNIVVVLGVSFLMVSLEDMISFPFASLIGVMAMAMTLQKVNVVDASVLSQDYSKLWMVGEIFLFVLVGASVNIDYAMNLGFLPVILVLLVLVFRMLGVFVSLLKTDLNFKERLFCMIAYSPKATVQAAIGGIPLALGLECGEVVLTVAVVSILVSAPLGAFLIDNTYKKLLD